MSQVILLVLVGLLAWGAVSDLLTLTIPNRVSVAIIALYPAWVFAMWPAVDPLLGLACGLGVLAVSFALFCLKIFGGGDAKFLSAICLWAGPHHLGAVLLTTAVAGGLLAIIVLAYLTVRNREFTIVSHALANCQTMAREPTPYGIAIGLGGVHLVYRLVMV
ncbi:MAG: peptidase [Alphaproteobacteria bacterium]|nr:peptidase [Alphaproteobacteria bacterium]